VIPIVTPSEMAAVDAAAPEPVDVLIGRAGHAVARAALDLLGGAYGRRVVVLAGKGNNGNDGRDAARRLGRRGVQVTIVDATDDRTTLPAADLVVDAAYGTGFRGTWTAPRPADPSTPVLAVDIPSGISGDTGEALGSPLHATRTVTFAACKPGLLLRDGPAHAGEVTVADIGLDVDHPKPPRAWLVTDRDVRAWLPERPVATHKWAAAVRLVAGSPGMTGAAELAATAALRAGAGYVRRSSPGIDPATPGTGASAPIEAVTTALPAAGWAADVEADLDRFGALAVGPGLGTGDGVATDVRRLVTAPLPMVIDGDGLGALGDELAAALGARPTHLPPVVLTPHEGEFARLGGVLDGGRSRFDAVRDLAARTGAIVLLKGSTTLVGHPDGRILATDQGDARLATAGTGDVLTGVIAAFLARGVPPLEAAAAAAYVHGRAARLGPGEGLVASDLPLLVTQLLTRPVIQAGRSDTHPMNEDGAPTIRRSTHGR
jgi:NAD(P)H-hydrate epimerase